MAMQQKLIERIRLKEKCLITVWFNNLDLFFLGLAKFYEVVIDF